MGYLVLWELEVYYKDSARMCQDPKQKKYDLAMGCIRKQKPWSHPSTEDVLDYIENDPPDPGQLLLI